MNLDAFERVMCKIVYRIYEECLDCEGRTVVSSKTLGDFPTKENAETVAKNAGFKQCEYRKNIWEKRGDFKQLRIERKLEEE